MNDIDVVVYSAPGVELTLPFGAENETVCATQTQMIELFGADKSGISRHVRNVFSDKEVREESNMQEMQNAESDRPVMLAELSSHGVAHLPLGDMGTFARGGGQQPHAGSLAL